MNRFLALGPVVLTCVGCSFLLTFEEGNRPCGPDVDPEDGLGDCLDGYSCLVKNCVANGSVAVGSTCKVNAHCEQDAVCTTTPFMCRESCEFPYGVGECGADEACVAMRDASDQRTGVCVTADCTYSSSCRGTNARCVDIKEGVGRCLETCTVTCTVESGCTNNCAFANSVAQACQPVALGNVLSCIPEGDRRHGDACNLTSLLCDADHACVMTPTRDFGVCLKYCADGLVGCDGLTDPATGGSAECNPISGTDFSACGQLPSSAPPPDGGPQGDPGPGDPDPGDPDPGDPGV